MSDDLISRKQAIKAVKTIIQAGLPEESIYAELEEIPTAYSADLVCDELENYLFKKYCIEGDGKIDDIVRNGGKK